MWIKSFWINHFSATSDTRLKYFFPVMAMSRNLVFYTWSCPKAQHLYFAGKVYVYWNEKPLWVTYASRNNLNKQSLWQLVTMAVYWNNFIPFFFLRWADFWFKKPSSTIWLLDNNLEFQWRKWRKITVVLRVNIQSRNNSIYQYFLHDTEISKN